MLHVALPLLLLSAAPKVVSPEWNAVNVKKELAAFYADAVPVARRLIWRWSHELELLGLEVDMLKVGCPRDGIQPILAAVRANLDHLNSIRCRIFVGKTSGGMA